jgi:hypothetical protein
LMMRQSSVHKSRRDKADDLLWPPDDLFFSFSIEGRRWPFHYGRPLLYY